MSNDQFELPLEARGEAPTAERSDEALSATRGTARLGDDVCQLMERVVEGKNLRQALKRVQRNTGSAGGMACRSRVCLTICANTGVGCVSSCSRVVTSRAW